LRRRIKQGRRPVLVIMKAQETVLPKSIYGEDVFANSHTRAENFFSPTKKKDQRNHQAKKYVKKKKLNPYISNAYFDPCGSRVLMNS